MTHRQFLQHQVESLTDGISITCKNNCGQCHKIRLGGLVAKRMLEAPLSNNAIQEWSDLTQKRWMTSKYMKLWNSERKAGRDPEAVFKKKGWQM